MFKLQPNPTFKVDVTIPRPEGDGTIKFEFKHKGRKALKEFYDSIGEGDNSRPDLEVVLDLIAGWSGVDTPFSPEALDDLLDNYPGSTGAIFEAYRKGLVEGRQKN